MTPARYRTIVADPPWPMPRGGSQGAKSAFKPRSTSLGALPYEAMTLDEIFLDETYDIVRGWGFKPSTLLTWAKTPRGIGLGGAFTQTTEHILYGRRGSLAALRRMDSTWWNWPRGEHSAKPDAFLDIVEQVSPGPYVELFARRARFGWDYFGDESLGTAKLTPTSEEAA